MPTTEMTLEDVERLLEPTVSPNEWQEYTNHVQELWNRADVVRERIRLLQSEMYGAYQELDGILRAHEEYLKDLSQVQYEREKTQIMREEVIRGIKGEMELLCQLAATSRSNEEIPAD